MHHHMPGEDPQRALYRHRERLDLTDPPVAAPPRSHHLDVLRGVPAVISALAIIAMLAADSAPVAPPNLDAHGTNDTQTPTVPGHPINAPHHVTGPAHRHLTFPHHHLKEALR